MKHWGSLPAARREAKRKNAVGHPLYGYKYRAVRNGSRNIVISVRSW